MDKFNDIYEFLKTFHEVSLESKVNAINEIVFHRDGIDDRKFPFEVLLKVTSKLPTTLANRISSELITRFWGDLEHPPRYWPGTPFRSADGSNNSHIYPQMGAYNTSFAQSVIGHGVRDSLPDPELLFERLMKRTSAFEPHPNKINSLLFGLAGFITHDLFHSDPINPGINKTTHYLDLSPVYGVNSVEQKKVRTFDNGFIHPDTFADRRLQFQIPTIVIMAIIFSRNHNHIVQELLNHNEEENYRFTHISGKDSPEYTKEQKDEMLFQTARLINCACYINLVINEYLKTILDIDVGSTYTLDPLITPPAKDPINGNVLSIEFGYLYRWHGALSQKNVEWLEYYPILRKYSDLRKELQKTYIKKNDDEEEIDFHQEIKNYISQHEDAYKRIVHEFGYDLEEFERGPICIGIHRNKETRCFPDDKLKEILINSMNDIASKMGARKVPVQMKEIDVQAIHSARKLGMCTLNEFRKYFRLKPYESYKEMLSAPGIEPDQEIIQCLEELYGKNRIDDVELYPGVAIEATKSEGLGLSYTISRAIVADATNLLRNDRFYNEGLNAHTLTKWGYQYANCDEDVESHVRNPVFRKMIMNCFSGWEEHESRLLSPFRV